VPPIVFPETIRVAPNQVSESMLIVENRTAAAVDYIVNPVEVSAAKTVQWVISGFAFEAGRDGLMLKELNASGRERNQRMAVEITSATRLDDQGSAKLSLHFLLSL